MDSTWKEIIWLQFGAAIDMLENAMLACPEELWSDRSEHPEFWYIVYHVLFWLDLYLSDSAEGFVPPPPFTLSELDPTGLLPERVYTKNELQTYLGHGRRKCREKIEALTDEKAHQRFVFGTIDLKFGELILYNMRHIQHRAAQLNLILRQKFDLAPRWGSDKPGVNLTMNKYLRIRKWRVTSPLFGRDKSILQAFYYGKQDNYPTNVRSFGCTTDICIVQYKWRLCLCE